ncbi:hypothetical protein Efla_000477 [Eimeria flavescens]
MLKKSRERQKHQQNPRQQRKPQQQQQQPTCVSSCGAVCLRQFSEASSACSAAAAAATAATAAGAAGCSNCSASHEAPGSTSRCCCCYSCSRLKPSAAAPAAAAALLEGAAAAATAVASAAAAAAAATCDANGSSALLQLPTHLLLLVFCFLGAPGCGLSTAAAVCRRFRAALKADLLWRHFFYARFLPRLSLRVRRFYGISANPEGSSNGHSGSCSSSSSSSGRDCNSSSRDSRSSSSSISSTSSRGSSSAVRSSTAARSEVAEAGHLTEDPAALPCTAASSSSSNSSSNSSGTSAAAAKCGGGAGGGVGVSWFCLYDGKDRLERQFASGVFESKRSIQVAPHGVPVLDVLLIDGGQQVAFAAADGRVGVACADSGDLLAALQQQQQLQQQQRPAAALALAHVASAPQQQQQQQQQLDGCLLAGYADGVVRLWCLQQQQQLCHLETSAGGVHALCLPSSSSSSGLLVWAGCSSGDLLLLSLGEGRMQQLSLFGGHEGGVLSVAFQPATGLFFSGAKDRMVFGYDPRASLRPVCRLPHGDWVASLDTAGDAQLLQPHLIRTGDKRVHAWDIRSPDSPIPEPQHRQHCHKQLISGVRSDALRLVSCSLDGSVLASSLEGAANCSSGSSSSSSSGSLLQGPTELLDAAAAGAAAAAAAAATAAAAAALPRAVGQQHSAWLMAVDFTETRLTAAAADGQVYVYSFERRSSKPHAAAFY